LGAVVTWGGVVDWTDQTIDQLYVGIGRRIREARTKLAKNQSDLARDVELTRSSIANIEAGRQKILTHSLIRIASFLDVPVDDLLPDAEELRKSVASSSLALDLSDHSEETQHFVTTALQRTREAKRGSIETT
jgi:transcriptional regulator with XRE-family HTH domain